MAEVIDVFLTFIREYPLIVLGIMVLGVVYLFLDKELAFLCPEDNSALRRIGMGTFRCSRCGFVKRV